MKKQIEIKHGDELDITITANGVTTRFPSVMFEEWEYQHDLMQVRGVGVSGPTAVGLAKQQLLLRLEAFNQAPTQQGVPLSEDPTPSKASNDRYPHKCPKCGGPAYVGAMSVDCESLCGVK